MIAINRFSWHVFHMMIVIACISIMMVACLKPRVADNDGDDKETEKYCQTGYTLNADQTQCIPSGGSTPSGSTTLESAFMYSILENGTSDDPNFIEKRKKVNKESGTPVLVAATGVKTRWIVQIKSKNEEVFASKLIPPEVEGEGFKHEAKENHKYEMVNYFTSNGETSITFKAVSNQLCKQKYPSNSCTVDTAPEDVTASIKVPIAVIGVIAKNTNTTCAIAEVAPGIFSTTTPGKTPVNQVIVNSIAAIIKINNGCQ